MGYSETTQGIRIDVEPAYIFEQSVPEANQFIFSYKIKITNEGDTSVQLMSRHWIITDGKGVAHEVKGPGVIGMQPTLKPGDIHEYESFCPLETPTGNMRGTYQMTNSLGAQFDVRIPLFFLRDMRNLH